MQRLQLFALNCVLSAPDWDVYVPVPICTYIYAASLMLLVSSLVIAAEAMSVD